MGISIEAIVEYGGNGDWTGFGEFDFGKNRLIHHVLGHSEYGTYPLRGRPVDLSWFAITSLSFDVRDTHRHDNEIHDYVLRSIAEQEVKSGMGEWVDEKQDRIYFKRSVSWIMRDELADLLPHFAEDWITLELMTAILEMMKILSPLGNPRLIYWFS